MSAPHDPLVAVLFSRERPAASSLGEFVASPQRYLADAIVPLSEALATSWNADAHVLAYGLFDSDGDAAWARVKKRSSFLAEHMADGGTAACSGIFLDHDLKDGDKKGQWSSEALEDFIARIGDLPEHLIPSAWFTTLHGSRFCFTLTEPVSPSRAENLVRALIHEFAKVGVEMDSACTDWCRLFRLPRVLRDGVRTEEQSYFRCFEFDRLLDPSTITPEQPGSDGETFAAVAEYRAELLTPEECHELLWDVSPKTGREVKSKWQKDARVYLTGRDSYDYCFNEKVIDEDDKFERKKFAGSNDALLRIFGQMVGQLARVEGASPEGIYALLLGCIDQMQPTAKHPDWHVTAWDLCCRMWSNEQAQLEAERRARESEIVQAVEVRQDLLSLFRDKLPEQVPADPQAAEQWLRERMVASTGQAHHLMMRDGTYTVNPCGDSMLIPTIRDLGMTDVIETHELHGKVWREKNPRSILNGQAIPISRVLCSSVEDVAFISGDPGYRTLTIPIHQLDPHLAPLHSDEVDEWLRHFFGAKYERGIEWLSHALDVKRPVCALNLFGAPGAGKDLLVAGISECFRYKTKTDGAKVFTRFNDPLLETPLVHFNEGVPIGNMPGCNTTDQTFRALVSGGSISIEGKGQKTITAHVYPRIIFTSNGLDVMRAILGPRDLSEEDLRAVEVRLLTIEVPPAAADFLRNRGNYRHTAGWIKGDVPSRFVIAKHILALFAARKPSKEGSGRLLVEGDAGGLAGQLRQSRELELVLHALHIVVEGRKGADAMLAASASNRLLGSGEIILCPPGAAAPQFGAGLYVTTNALGEVTRALSDRVSIHVSASDLKHVGLKAGLIQDPGRPVRIGKKDPKRYLRVDLAKALEFWIEDGRDCPRTRAMFAPEEETA